MEITLHRRTGEVLRVESTHLLATGDTYAAGAITGGVVTLAGGERVFVRETIAAIHDITHAGTPAKGGRPKRKYCACGAVATNHEPGVGYSCNACWQQKRAAQVAAAARVGEASNADLYPVV